MRTRYSLLFGIGIALTGCSGTDFDGRNEAVSSQAGATLQASKTVDICTNDDGSWTYSGVVSVWNLGATDAAGLHIKDVIQNKAPSGPKWFDIYTALDSDEPGIPAYTPEELAYTFAYSVSGAPLAGDIRNNALVTIVNHSGGKTNGPNPKATWSGTPGPCSRDLGCTLTQGYWKTHNNDVCVSDATSPLCVTWPGGYNPDDLFFLSGQSWIDVLNTAPHGNQYYVLAHQYIAAVLNLANGAVAPAGVQSVIDAASAFFVATAPDACSTPGSCSLQATWAGTLDVFNNGCYPGGPAHCGNPDEAAPICL